MTGTTKIIHLLRGAQDGLNLYTTEELKEGETFWVPSHDLMETLSGRKLSEIRDMLDDPENERYLPHQSHLIAYVMKKELEAEDNLPVFSYVECPERTYERINARESSDSEQ